MYGHVGDLKLFRAEPGLYPAVCLSSKGGGFLRARDQPRVYLDLHKRTPLKNKLVVPSGSHSVSSTV